MLRSLLHGFRKFSSVTLQAASGPMALSPRIAACGFHLREEMPPGKDPRSIIAEFRATVNMSAEEVDQWLGTEDSRLAVKQVGEEADTEGRHAARRIVELLKKDDELYYEGDLLHMWQIAQYIRCHRGLLGQHGWASEQLRGSVDRFHLMNFGFDPLKEVGAGPSHGGADGSWGAGKPAGSRDRVVEAAPPMGAGGVLPGTRTVQGRSAEDWMRP